jgi:hypothetical protein
MYEKKQSTEYSKGNTTDQKKWLQQKMDTNRIPNKYYNINQKDEGT